MAFPAFSIPLAQCTWYLDEVNLHGQIDVPRAFYQFCCLKWWNKIQFKWEHQSNGILSQSFSHCVHHCCGELLYTAGDLIVHFGRSIFKITNVPPFLHDSIISVKFFMIAYVHNFNKWYWVGPKFVKFVLILQFFNVNPILPIFRCNCFCGLRSKWSI